MEPKHYFVETLYRGETVWQRGEEMIGPRHHIHEGFAQLVHRHDERRVQGLRLVDQDGTIILAMANPSRDRKIVDPARES